MVIASKNFDKSDFVAIIMYDPKDLGLGWLTWLHVQEGGGGNLDREDIEAGYVAYIDYSEWDLLEDFKLHDGDGGLILLDKPYSEYTTEEIMQKVLEFVYDEGTNLNDISCALF